MQAFCLLTKCIKIIVVSKIHKQIFSNASLVQREVSFLSKNDGGIVRNVIVSL